jgi:CheY-like chemotaxis protein
LEGRGILSILVRAITEVVLDTEQPQSLPLALNHAIQAHAAKAYAQGRLFSFKILHPLPTWIATDLASFRDELEECLAKQLAKSRAREMYVICSLTRLPDHQIELEFTSTDLPGFKLSSDAKPFFTYRLKPFSERETFKHLLPLENESTELRLVDELLSGYCILIVDDSEDALTHESRLVEKFGGKAVCARTGEEAIDKALSEHFDIVLMDIKMPNVDGNQAMKTLVDRRYRMPVVALSAFSSVKERKDSLSHGFADYLSKPIVPEQLIRTIARLTNRSLPIVHSVSEQNAHSF